MFFDKKIDIWLVYLLKLVHTLLVCYLYLIAVIHLKKKLIWTNITWLVGHKGGKFIIINKVTENKSHIKICEKNLKNYKYYWVLVDLQMYNLHHCEGMFYFFYLQIVGSKNTPNMRS